MDNSTKLSYTGYVNLNLVIGDKSIKLGNHNLGLPYLMKAFCKFITGNYEGKVDIPQYIDLRKSEDNWATMQTCLSQQIPLSGRSYEFDNNQSPPNWVAKLNAVINHSMLIEDIEEGIGIKYRIYLYTGVDESDPSSLANDIAYLEVADTDLARIVPGTQAIVEWTLQISNPMIG